MSEEPASKRRRFEGAPTNQPSTPPLHVDSIDSLPDAVLQHCFSFVAKGHYRFVAGTSRRFKEIYSIKHESKTMWESAASSVAGAELCLDDFKENGGEEDTDCLEMTTKGALKIGNINVLEWARIKGFAFDSEHFLLPAFNGHLCVLQWAEEKNLEWYGEDTLLAAAKNDHIHIFEWVYNSEREMLGIGLAVRAAAFGGQIPMLSWMKERNLLDASSGPDLYKIASVVGDTNVLDWVYDNEFVVCPHSIFLGAAASGDNYLKPLVWARQHGIPFDEYACACAASYGKLPMLQWLRENECPWDADVIIYAEDEGHNHVLEWAIANGCPTDW